MSEIFREIAIGAGIGVMAVAGAVAVAWLLMLVGRILSLAAQQVSGFMDEALIWAAVKADVKAKRKINLSAKAAARNSKK